MDVMIAAGGIPRPEEPLYNYTQGRSKAMLDIAGKPMIQWVLDAISEAEKVDNVIIIGLSKDSKLICKKHLFFVPNQGSMLDNIVAGIDKILELNPIAEYVITASSDIPGITGAMIDWLVEISMQTQHDIYYGVVKRDKMEARYPNANRTYTKLADMELCGADIHIVHKSMTTDPEHLAMWDELLGKRKSPLKQAASIGFMTLFLLLIRRLSLNGAIERITKRLNITGRAIMWDDAEPAMDVDKPHQLDILRADLTN